MPPFIVTYDLNKEDTSEDYEPLIKDLRSRGAHRYQASCWLVNLNNTAAAVYDHYRGLIDENDSLMVSELTRNHKQGCNKKGTTDWIKANPPAR